MGLPKSISVYAPSERDAAMVEKERDNKKSPKQFSAEIIHSAKKC